MAGIDTSIYANVGSPQSKDNLVNNIYNMMQMKTLANQNQLFQQEYQAKLAMGQILPQAVNKETGTVDFNRAGVLLALDPRTAAFAPKFISDAIQMGKAQADAVKQQLDNTKLFYSLIGDSMAPIMAKGVNASQGDVLQAAAGLIQNLKANGALTPQIQDIILTTVAQAPTTGEGLKDWAKGINMRSMDAKARAELLEGKLYEMDMGGSHQIVQVVDGKPQVVFSQRKTLAPQAPTDFDKKRAALIRSGLAPELADGVAAGRYETSRDPNTGEATIIDVATGARVGGGTGRPSVPVPATSIPKDIETGAGTGVSGVLANLTNTVADALGANLPYPKAEKAANALAQMKVRTQSLLQEAIEGRPSNELMKRLDAVAVIPNSLFTGDNRARERLASTKGIIDEEINRIQKQILDNPNKYKKERVQDAEENQSQLKLLSNSYGQLITGFDRGRKAKRKPLNAFQR